MRPRVQRLLHDTLLASAEVNPDATVVVTDGTSHSYGELLANSLRLAAALQERGVRRGDRVAIYMENSWPAAVGIYATLLAGGTVTVVNPQTKSDKLAYILADCEARALVADAHLANQFLPALERASSVRVVLCSEPVVAAAQVVSLGDAVANAPLQPDAPGVIPLDLAAIIYTSGSTGSPKGVMMTHQSMVFAAGSIAEYLGLERTDRILNVLPLAFDYGLYQLLMAVSVGAALVLERSFAFPVTVLRRAIDEQVTVFPLVPTIAATVLSSKKRTDWVLPSVTRVTNTAAALPADFIPRLKGVFPRARIFAMYGLTECKRVSYLEPDRLAQKPTSVGKAIPGTEVFLLTPDGRPVPPGEPGILHVRGPHVMLGYWNQPELSAHMLKPGRLPGERVLCTHDFFTMDTDGDLYFVGRTDDIIKTRGEKVSPIEVENVLHRVPGVREAAVVGVPDEVLGEAIRAFVVLDDGARLTEQEIRKACLRDLESYMVPRDVVFLDELPQTTTAKIQKKGLRELFVP